MTLLKVTKLCGTWPARFSSLEAVGPDDPEGVVGDPDIVVRVAGLQLTSESTMIYGIKTKFVKLLNF